MKRLAICAALAALVLAGNAQAETVTFKLDGIKCDTCCGDILGAIKKVATVKVKTEPTQAKPVAVVEIDLAKSDVGAVGKSVADADTPHKSCEAPAAYVVITASKLAKEDSKKIDKALEKIKGVNAALSSVDVKGKQILVRLDASGSAKLAEIQKALAEFTK